MKISYSRSFKKMFKKQPKKIQNKFGERLKIFAKDQSDSILRNHGLTGEWIGCFSINVTGDIRAVFEKLPKDTVEFIAIGSHSELYK